MTATWEIANPFAVVSSYLIRRSGYTPRTLKSNNRNGLARQSARRATLDAGV